MIITKEQRVTPIDSDTYTRQLLSTTHFHDNLAKIKSDVKVILDTNAELKIKHK